jgi:[acyl-carrier-protein] S-malonyltransferase
VLVLVAPGQGAQAPGFLTPWLELPGVADRLKAWSDVAGLDLVRYGTEAGAEEIRDTAVAQPLLVAAGLVSSRLLLDGIDGHGGSAVTGRSAIGAVAGHSVGELTAAATAGVLSDEDTMAIVRLRGLAMAEAAATAETGMSAVLGGDPDTVIAHLEKLGLAPANINGAGQIVAAGTAEQLAALTADKPEKARVIPLKVAGAFHTRHMAPAVGILEAALADVVVGEPLIRLVSNKDGQVVADGMRFVQRLVDQVANPVRWDLCMETFVGLGVTALIEVCPGGALTGLAKRGMPGVKTLALKTPADLDAARGLLAEYATAGPAE